MSESKAERLHAVWERALRRFDADFAATRDVRAQCAQDRRFYLVPGAAWDGSLGAQFANKPKLEFNKARLAIDRLVGEYRASRMHATFAPRNQATAESAALAEAATELHRAAEHESRAEEAYDNAFEEQVSGGMGGWRLRAVAEDEADEESGQLIKIEPIYEAEARLFLGGGQRSDKSDATWGLVLTPSSREDFEAVWGEDVSGWKKSELTEIGVEFEWWTPDTVFVGEYYEVSTRKTRVLSFAREADGAVIEADEAEIEADAKDNEGKWVSDLQAQGYRVQPEARKAVRREVRKWILGGSGVLEDCGLIPGPNIPLVVAYGARAIIDGCEYFSGHLRASIDAARLKNMLVSKLAEVSASASQEKPIFTPEQIAGHQDRWANDQVENYPYQLVNAVRDVVSGQMLPPAPIGYTKPPDLPQAMAALITLVEGDLRELLGSQEQAEKLLSNVSERTVGLVQAEKDRKTFIYHSNFQRSVRRSGEIWLGMAKVLFVEPGRRMRGRTAEGAPSSYEVGKASADPKTKAVYAELDFKRAVLDLEVVLGPSSASRRAGAVRDLTEMGTRATDPELQTVFALLALQNSDAEGARELQPYARRRLVQLGALEPDEKEKATLAEQRSQPSAQDQYLIASAEKAAAGALVEAAREEKTRAETLEILENVDRSNVDQVARLQGQSEQSGATAQPAVAPMGEPLQ